MNFQVTVQPSGRVFEVERDETMLSAAIRQGVGLPYGCRDGACGSCKSRLLEGRVIHGAHQPKTLTSGRLRADLLRHAADRLPARSAHGARRRRVPDPEAAQPRAEHGQTSGDVAVIRLQLPATQNFQFHAGQYVEFILRDGARRSYSMANAPHNLGTPASVELHIRHMPGGKFTDHVFGAMKEKDILRMEGPFGSFFLREDSAKPMVLLASGTGFAPIKAIIERMQELGTQRPAMLYWGCRSKADLYLHDWALQAAASMPNLRYVPVLSEPRPETAGTAAPVSSTRR